MHSKYKFNNKTKIMVMAFTLMFTQGVVNNFRGQIGPLIMDDFALNYSQLGFLLSFLSAGAIIIYFISGKLIEEFGLIKVLIYGLIHTAAALIAVYLSPGYYTLLISFFAVGIGLTLLNMVSVTIISLSFSDTRGKMINLLHLFYGLGGIVSPYIVTLVINNGFRWAHSFLFALILIFILVIEFKTSSLPETEASKNKSVHSTKVLISDKTVILFALVVFIQVGIEFSIVTWLAPFLKDIQARPEVVISFFLSLFFIVYTVGRLLASLVVERLGYYNFLIYTQIAAALFITIALIGGRPFTIFFSLSGIFLAVQVPTSQAVILNSFGKSGIKVVGIVQTAGTMGAVFLSNWIIGFISDIFGVKAAFISTLILLLILLVLTFYLKNLNIKERFNN